MTRIISRLYAYAMDAEAAIRDLRANRLRDNQIFVVRPPPKGERPCLEALAALIAQCAILKPDADIYARRVARGGTLVAVHAPYDKTYRVSALLDIRDPVLRSIGPRNYPPLPWDDAAPFSSFMQWPTLLDEPTPFAKFWSLPTLVEGRVFASRGRRPRRYFRSAAPLSDFLGVSLLSESATPFSDAMNWPVLWDNPTPLSRLFGWKVLQ